jgi:hypothetical protein
MKVVHFNLPHAAFGITANLLNWFPITTTPGARVSASVTFVPANRNPNEGHCVHLRMIDQAECRVLVWRSSRVEISRRENADGEGCERNSDAGDGVEDCASGLPALDHGQ